VPIIDRMVMVGLVALAMLAASPTHAAATASPQRVVQVVLNDAKVIRVSKNYVVVSQGAMLYHLCPEEYHVDAAKRDFSNRKFDEVSQRYMAAFATAHQERVGKLPSHEIYDMLGAHMSEQQTQAKQGIAQLITQQGCRNTAGAALDTYWMNIRAADEAKAAQTNNTPTTKN